MADPQDNNAGDRSRACSGKLLAAAPICFIASVVLIVTDILVNNNFVAYDASKEGVYTWLGTLLFWGSLALLVSGLLVRWKRPVKCATCRIGDLPGPKANPGTHDEHYQEPESTLNTDVVSIVQRALGADYERLHPKIREQYAISSKSEAAFVGKGVMEDVWHGRWYVVPFLHVGALRRILFPETGKDIPFKISNYAYQDRFGRETVTWKRSFDFPARQREFDEFFVFSESRGTPIIYAGTHQHLSVDLHFAVDDDGAIIVTTGSQRLFVGPLTIPFPRLLSGDGYVRESYNETLGRFEVDVSIANPYFGKILGYRGSFDLERIACTRQEIPAGTIPVRENHRE